VELHALFDVLAWATTALTVVLLRRLCADRFPPAPGRSMGYLAAVIFGAAIGAYLLGSLNLWLAGMSGLGRSIEGALAGAILAVELYKRQVGISGRTAALYALPVALGIAVGRIGCFLAGMDDFTYGTPTDLPWGHDFGDGVLRHPVQLYESLGMLLFSLAYVVALARRNAWVIENGFALFVLTYASVRLGLEFIKPYPAVLFGLTVFQLVGLAMMAYALAMLRPRRLLHAGH
jgi:phosphatidylglycerol---prolipoprotein diacylglyceryl transferase